MKPESPPSALITTASSVILLCLSSTLIFDGLSSYFAEFGYYSKRVLKKVPLLFESRERRHRLLIAKLLQAASETDQVAPSLLPSITAPLSHLQKFAYNSSMLLSRLFCNSVMNRVISSPTHPLHSSKTATIARTLTLLSTSILIVTTLHSAFHFFFVKPPIFDMLLDSKAYDDFLIKPNILSSSTLDLKTGILTYRGGLLRSRIDRLLVKTVVVESDVTAIHHFSLIGLVNAEHIIFVSDSCVTIGMFSLLGCRSLKTITLPEKCISVQSFALASCASLHTIILPKSKSTLLQLGMFACFNCRSLRSVHLPPERVNVTVFAGCTTLEALAAKDGDGDQDLTVVDTAALISGSAVAAVFVKLENSITYCRKEWRNRKTEMVSQFKINVEMSFKRLDSLHVGLLLDDDGKEAGVGIDKASILWVIYEKVASDDVRRKILEYLDYELLGF